ncbi:hypothetical protein P261_00047 [Lachnospiraceae bacterium TWA4]|nr:hypothetical protein P261_00047 [Lachnospiraceae bacterium TWA4]
MVTIDLITGFLGAGKTTFLKLYAQYWMNKGQNIGILENDYGAVNVDMMLLQDMMGDNCELEMVAGGCDYDCHRRRFKSKLISMGMCGYDRVIVEPSGIYDVEEFFDVLQEDPLDRWYRVGNVITIVDANLEKNLSKQARYLLMAETAQAGAILLSKTKNAPVDETIHYLNGLLQEFGCDRVLGDEVITKDFLTFTDNDFDKLNDCGYTRDSYRKLWFEKEEAFQSVYFMNDNLTVAQVEQAIDQIFSNPACGKVSRIKGFAKDEAGCWMEINATSEHRQVEPIKEGQDVVIVIGENLDEEKIKELL